MKVLVTGGCGFLGSHLCEFYATRGDQVVSYDNMTKHELQRTGFATEAARKHNFDYLKTLGVKMVVADVRNFSELLDHAHDSDYIIHTAAQPAMTISWEDPLLDFSTNVSGTFNVLEVARRVKIPVASCATIHVYGNEINQSLKEGKTRYLKEPEAIDEAQPILRGTLTPLHASKAAADMYVKAYADTYKLEAASFRLTGIYGTRQFGGEDHGWVANFSIRSVLDKPITIFGTGKQVRDILYASDVCAAFDAFYRRRNPGIYNIGGGIGNAISLLDCVEILAAIVGRPPTVNFAADRHGDLRYFVCDTTRATERLRWQPKVKPREGIERLVAWVESNRQLFEQEAESTL
ncbi:MAG TPA: NAD-dependent epimerase/dehydratase family protein [Syntrophobacteria bacterium]|nr:NAD-dependent epimerase/dehydratase family protein [Syntrophobacteria bacterium]